MNLCFHTEKCFPHKDKRHLFWGFTLDVLSQFSPLYIEVIYLAFYKTYKV